MILYIIIISLKLFEIHPDSNKYLLFCKSRCLLDVRMLLKFLRPSCVNMRPNHRSVHYKFIDVSFIDQTIWKYLHIFKLSLTCVNAQHPSFFFSFRFMKTVETNDVFITINNANIIPNYNRRQAVLIWFIDSKTLTDQLMFM